MALDKVIDSAQLDADLTAVADAIRTKGGTTGELEFPDGFVSAVEGIQAGGGGDTSIEDALLAGTLDGIYTNNRVTKIGDYALRGQSITGICAENVTEIGSNSFQSCAQLTSLQFGDKLKTIGRYCFDGCTAITELAIASAEYMGDRCFQNCTALESVSLQNVTILKSYTFSSCTKLKSAYIPKVKTLEQAAFGYDESLELLDLPSVSDIRPTAVHGCTNLKTLILRCETLCNLANVSAFNNTPFASGKTGGTVYVPSALITQYQQATNWSTLFAAGTCNFVAIEGSEYE